MISKRLQAIVEWIDGTVMADIGCDHGYVCIEAILQNKVKKAYACDIAQGPLQNAKETIKKYHLENQIECQLMNGLSNLKEDVDLIVIAGMGAMTMIDILQSYDMKKGMNLICCPHKDVELFRNYLSKSGYEIIKEKMIFEDHFYPILYITYSGVSYSLSEHEQYYGYRMIQDEIFGSNIESEIKKWTTIYQKCPDSKKISLEKRLEVLKKIR